MSIVFHDALKFLSTESQNSLENSERIKLDDNDILWHTLRLEYFMKILQSSEISMFNILKNKDIENIFKIYIKHYSNKDNKENWKSVFEQVISYTYISCWYNSVFISEDMLKKFAGVDNSFASGIAFSTTLTKLKSYFEKSTDYDFYIGNIQYISEKKLHFSSSKDNNICNLIVPFFYKNTHFHSENETRILFQKTLDSCHAIKPKHLDTTKPHKIKIDLIELIDEIVIPTSSCYYELVELVCKYYNYELKEKNDTQQDQKKIKSYYLKKGT